MCVCVCVYVCMYVHTYVCVYVYKHVFCVYACARMYVCVCMYACMYAFLQLVFHTGSKILNLKSLEAFIYSDSLETSIIANIA